MISKLILDTLNNIGVPVSFMKYSGTATTYITFFEYMQQGESYADNTEKNTGHYIQVDIWSKTDYTTLRNSTLAALKAVGFSKTYETEMFESDTLIYHKILRLFYLEEV
ncbi:MAG TPA: hypothetical protein VIK34_05765 [Clostridiaceae bacterium]